MSKKVEVSDSIRYVLERAGALGLDSLTKTAALARASEAFESVRRLADMEPPRLADLVRDDLTRAGALTNEAMTKQLEQFGLLSSAEIAAVKAGVPDFMVSDEARKTFEQISSFRDAIGGPIGTMESISKAIGTGEPLHRIREIEAWSRPDLSLIADPFAKAHAFLGIPNDKLTAAQLSATEAALGLKGVDAPSLEPFLRQVQASMGHFDASMRAGTLAFADAHAQKFAADFGRMSASLGLLLEAIQEDPERFDGASIEDPVHELYRHGRLLDSFTDEPLEADDREASGDEHREYDAGAGRKIADRLRKLDASLLEIRRGAVAAAESKHVDYVRHVTTSLRELLTQVLHGLAPDKEVLRWNRAPDFVERGRPTRRGRLSFIARHRPAPPYISFLGFDIDSALEVINSLHGGVHRTSTKLTEMQVWLLIHRVDGLLLWMFEMADPAKGQPS